MVERAKIMGCYSKDIGAAVTVSSSGSFTMKAGEIRYNYTASSTENTDGERAGVIYGEPSHSNAGSVIDISNTTISDNNTAGNGGAIFGYNVILKNCIVERNIRSRLYCVAGFDERRRHHPQSDLRCVHAVDCSCPDLSGSCGSLYQTSRYSGERIEEK